MLPLHVGEGSGYVDDVCEADMFAPPRETVRFVGVRNVVEALYHGGRWRGVGLRRVCVTPSLRLRAWSGAEPQGRERPSAER